MKQSKPKPASRHAATLGWIVASVPDPVKAAGGTVFGAVYWESKAAERVCSGLGDAYRVYAVEVRIRSRAEEPTHETE